ncbi:MAG: hypothetical protein V4675_18485 [Verrucomicrobiota bacterium]
MFIIDVLATLWVTSLSMLLIVGLERRAFRIRGAPLSAWQRWLTPLPLILLVGANLDSILSLLAWSETHPYGSYSRFSDNQAWNTDRFFVLGLIVAGLLPFALSHKPRQLADLVPLFWIGYFVWFLFVWTLLASGTGLPIMSY